MDLRSWLQAKPAFALALLLIALSARPAHADPDLLVELPLNDGSGTTAIDVSGNGNNGSLLGGPLFESDTGDGSAFAVHLDGNDDFINLGALDVAGTGLTLATWFKADSFPGKAKDPRLISKASGTAGKDHVFMLSTIKVGTVVRLRTRVRVSGSTTTLIASSGDLSTATWHHAAMTYDGSVLRLYLDAVEVGNTPLSGAVDMDVSIPVAVGAQSPGAGGKYFPGLMDDLRIFQRGLSAAEVAAILDSNLPPTALDDAYGALEDITLAVDSVSGVLSNDTDPEMAALEALLVDDVLYGTLDLNLDGSFSYTPDPGFSSTDQFTYQASDGARVSDLATVTLSVVGSNDAPTAVNDGYPATVDTPLLVNVANGVLNNDTDPELDLLSAILVDDVAVGTGTLTLNLDGSFLYSPMAGFVGQATFTYLANDSFLDSNLATVTIDVAASSPSDALVELPLDTGSGLIAVDASGNGNDGDLLGGAGYEANTADDSAFAIRLDGSDDYIDLGVLDVVGSELTLSTWFNADSYPGSAKDPRLISKASGTAGNAHIFMLGTIKVGTAVRLRTRVRVGGLTTTLIAGSGNLAIGTWHHGAMTYDGSTLRLYLDGVEVGSTSLSGPVDMDASVPVAVGAQPPGAGGKYFPGLMDDVRITERALSASEIGDLLGSNLAPTALDDGYAALEDSPLVVDALNGVLDNDSDPEMGALEAVLVNDVTQGVLSLNTDGSFVYTPNSGFSAVDQFTYRASDGSKESNLATVTLSVVGNNDAPTAVDDGYPATVDTPLLVNVANGVLNNDTDPELDLLSAILVDDVAVGTGTLTLNLDGSFLYSPMAGFVGQATFTYLANDSFLDSNLATVTIDVAASSPSDALVELPLDTGSGLIAVDASGNGNDGDLLGGAGYEANTADDSAFAIRLDGSDDYIDLGVLDVVGSELTLSTWFNADSYPGSAKDPRLISKASGTAGNDHVFMLGTIKVGSAVRLRTRVRVGGSTTTLIASSGDLAAGAWHHGAMTYDGSTLRLYLDGVEVGSTPLSGPVDMDPSVPVAVGAQPPGAGGKYFPGLMDDVRITERALSATEISDLVGAPPPPGGDMTPPAAPTEVIAIPLSETSVEIGWNDAVDNVAMGSYSVFRDGVEIASGLPGTQLIDSGLASGISYEYTVVARDLAGNDSPMSAVASAQPLLAGAPTWFDPAFGFRIPIDVDANGTTRKGRYVEVSIDFTAALASAGEFTALDLDSLRVVRANASGQALDTDVSFQFDPAAGFDAATNAVGELVIRLAGTAIDTDFRRYDFYFDVVGESFAPAVVASRVFVSNTLDEGQNALQIDTATSSYFLQEQGASLSSLVDSDGEDWINYRIGGGSAGDYRGIPNLVYPESEFHPGGSTGVTTIEAGGPLRLRIKTTALSGTWEATWSFYDDHTSMTVERIDHDYWFLYEGTPGGQLETDSDFVTRSDGTQTLTGANWDQDIVGEEWVYFGDPNAGRSLFLASHDDDTAADSYRPLDGQMTVFGFGRSGISRLLTSAPRTFSLGLIESLDFDVNAARIRSITQDLNIVVGSIELEGGSNPPGSPTAGNDGYSTPEDNALIVDAASGVLGNDMDPEMAVLEAILVTDVSNGVLNLNIDGSFDYTPNPNFDGADQFTYRASDGVLESNLATVILTVSGVNDAPTAAADAYQTPPDTLLVVDAAGGVLANDSDPEFDVMDAILVDDVSNGTLTLNLDGSFLYQPDFEATAADFTYQANDGVLDSNLVTVSISVGGDNAQPSIVTGKPAFSKQVVDNMVDETHAVVAADFTGDGEIDLAATDFVDGMIFWYENDGVGGFTTHILDANLEGAYPASVGDVDGDGDADVMAAGYEADTFVWYESDNAGGFTRHDVDTSSDGAHSILARDINDDGYMDLLTSSQDADRIAWYENDGAEVFTLKIVDTTADAAKWADAADLDGDGDLDIVIASNFDDTVAWYENDGAENFTKKIIDDTVNGAYFVSLADVDGDGDPDVFSASQHDHTIAWYRNDGASGFSTQQITAGALGARTVIAADIDGNGAVDAVSASVNDDTIAWYANDGSGQFSGNIVDSDAQGGYGVFVIDMNHDGLLDVLSASRDSAEVAIHTQSTSHFLTIGLGEIVTIDSTLLLAVDADDGPAELTFTISSPPAFGVLALSGLSIGIGDSFTQEDVDLGRLTYSHDGIDQTNDSFAFSMADGGESGSQPVSGLFDIDVRGFSGSLVELPLDEGSGTIAGNVSGNGADGVLENGALFEADSADGSPSSVRFDGTDDFIDLGNVDPTGTGLTVGAWFNADTFPGSSKDPRLISKATGPAANEHVFMLGTIAVGSEVRLRGRVRFNGETLTLIAASGNLAVGTWHHAAMTVDGDAIRLFLDGVEVGIALSFGSVDSAPAVPVAVGAQPPGAGGRYFDGLIDDVRILSRAMMATEISAIAAEGN